ncbi:MAG: hypothetical protein IKU72_04130 [Oscillospiraceae bacterium]|nr:hypothetical protein [Oscillospiraceae bacterium]
MKKIKQQAIYLAVLWALGAIMLLCAIFTDMNEMMTGMGCALLFVCTISLLKLWKISKNPDSVKQMEILQNEERLVFISNKAAKATLFSVIAIQYAAMLAAVFMRYNEIATLLGFFVCGQLLIYVFFSKYYSKKY